MNDETEYGGQAANSTVGQAAAKSGATVAVIPAGIPAVLSGAPQVVLRPVEASPEKPAPPSFEMFHINNLMHKIDELFALPAADADGSALAQEYARLNEMRKLLKDLQIAFEQRTRTLNDQEARLLDARVRLNQDFRRLDEKAIEVDGALEASLLHQAFQGETYHLSPEAMESALPIRERPVLSTVITEHDMKSVIFRLMSGRMSE